MSNNLAPPVDEETLTECLAAGRSENVFIGAAAAVGTSSRPPQIVTVGYADIDETTPVTKRTQFDLASLTKPIVTTTIALRLVESGELDLLTTIGDHVERAAGTARGEIPIRHLLTHTSGLPPYKSFPFGWDSKDSVLESLYESPISLLADPGELFVYSDLNFVLLADVIRHITDESLTDLAVNHVFEPLGLERAIIGPISNPDNVAMTWDRQWRNRVLHGEIHDYLGAAMDGESGNSGLFASVQDVVRVARMLLEEGQIDGSQVLAPSTVESIIADQIPNLNRPHGLGWRLAHEGNPGVTWAPSSVGHTGFTGTSMWFDPTRKIYAILLTNQLLTDGGTEGLKSFRTTFHDMVMANATSNLEQ